MSFVTKEKAAAYQNWQFTHFDDEHDENPPEVPLAKVAPLPRPFLDGEKAAQYQKEDIENFGDTPPEDRMVRASQVSEIIPKEKLTAYERWELAALKEGEEKEDALTPVIEAYEVPFASEAEIGVTEALEEGAALETAETQDVFVEEIMEPALLLPTAEEIEATFQEARNQGLAAGRDEGFAAGKEEGLSAARDEMSPDLTRINEIAHALKMATSSVNQSVADNLLALALRLAEQMARQALQVKPEMLLPIVHEALDALNAKQGAPLIFVAPEDAALLRQYAAHEFASNDWKMVEDANMARGGCRVELGQGQINATLETRIARVIESMGVNRHWLTQKMP